MSKFQLENSISGGIDELRIDPQLIATSTHTAFEHVAYAQLLGDLPNVKRFAFLGKARVSSDDE